MKTPFYAGPGSIFAMHWGRPLRLARGPGEIEVTRGRVWLTRAGDLDDHVLDAGRRLRVGSSDAVVLEPLHPGERTEVAWRPDGQPALARLAAWGWRAVAAGADAADAGLCRLAVGLAALARKAASIASRAQGRICADDSRACAGALQ